MVYDPSLITPDAIQQNIEDLGYGAQCVSEKTMHLSSRNQQTAFSTVNLQCEKAPSGGRSTVEFSIGGMTCASCVGTITNTLKSIRGVESHHIDLMSGSGTLVVKAQHMATTVQGEIENLGYDCKIMSVTAFPSQVHHQERDTDDQINSRMVNVNIEGFFCLHCPTKANKVLDELSQCFAITYTPLTLHNPASTLVYIPDPPSFTLRTVRSAISELGFTLTVVKPETLQDRARLAQKRERDRILFRLGVCTLFCIPTFIIGVVITSLLPMQNHVRMYFHTTIWGGASRTTIALFILATPIQLGIGQFFYKRAYASLRSVWRKSRGPLDRRRVWLDRLLRWGSMDTLVALGTSIAWASSLAYMSLDIVGIGNGEMAYFDTSVFLITFILAGRYLVRHSSTLILFMRALICSDL